MNNIHIISCVPKQRIGDIYFNVDEISHIVEEVASKGIALIVFPKLSLVGCSCGDLLFNNDILQAAEDAVSRCVSLTSNYPVTMAIGVPVRIGNSVYNCAAVVGGGKLKGIVVGEVLGIQKTSSLSNSEETVEKHNVAIDYAGFHLLTQSSNDIFSLSVSNVEQPITFSIEFGCKPLSSKTNDVAPADVLLIMDGRHEVVGLYHDLCDYLSKRSSRQNNVIAYCSAGWWESSGDGLFADNAIICQRGQIYSAGKRFSTEKQIVDFEFGKSYKTIVDVKDYESHSVNNLTQPFIPNHMTADEMAEEVFQIQSLSLAHRIKHTNSTTAVIGVSGGLDSTLALLVAVKAFDILQLGKKNIIGVTMPGFGTSSHTRSNAISLMEELGVTSKEIPIANAVKGHFVDIGHDIAKVDSVYENAQARERTQILMDLANMHNGLVIGTGDMSELALGWATYNGDHMSMYGVNAGVPKTIIRLVVDYIARRYYEPKVMALLCDVIDTPVSPELTPASSDGEIAQKTEDLVGPYELHDFFLYHFMQGSSVVSILDDAAKVFDSRYNRETIKKWLKVFCRRFISQQFKRSCMPDGPQVFELSLSPRGGWIMPSDAFSTLWMDKLS